MSNLYTEQPLLQNLWQTWYFVKNSLAMSLHLLLAPLPVFEHNAWPNAFVGLASNSRNTMEQVIEFATKHMLLVAGWVAVAIALLIAQFKHMTSGIRALVPQEVSHMVNRENALVVDIRPIADFNKGHIAGAKNILQSKLNESPAELEKHKSNPIILVCANGIQAGAAAQKLKKAGFESVHKLAGGIQAWLGDKLPVVKS